MAFWLPLVVVLGSLTSTTGHIEITGISHVQIGDPVILICNATAPDDSTSPPEIIEWYKNGNTLSSDLDRINISSSLDDASTSRVSRLEIVDSSTWNETGSYACRDNLNQVAVFIVLVFNYISTTTLSPCDGYRCQSGGGCIPLESRCDWKHDCPGLDDEMDCQDMTDNGTCPDGLYRCQSTDGCRSDSILCDGFRDCFDHGDDEQNCTGQIHIKGDTHVNIGDKIRLSCTVMSRDVHTPPDYVEWFKNGEKLIENHDRIYIEGNIWLNSRIRESYLTIENTRGADRGLYVCRSSQNESATVEVQVQGSFDPYCLGMRCAVNGECIPSRWRCDDMEDCIDGEDELNCGMDLTHSGRDTE